MPKKPQDPHPQQPTGGAKPGLQGAQGLTDQQKHYFLALMEEYRACRAEILERAKLQAQAVSVGATIIVALLTASITFSGGHSNSPIPAFLLLVVPLVYFFFGLFVSNNDTMVVLLASYIVSRLRPAVRTISDSGTDEFPIFGWDTYRANTWQERKGLLKPLRAIEWSFPPAFLTIGSLLSVLGAVYLFDKVKSTAVQSKIFYSLVAADIALVTVTVAATIGAWASYATLKEDQPAPPVQVDPPAHRQRRRR